MNWNKTKKGVLSLSIASALVFTARGALIMLVQLYLKELRAGPLVISFATSCEWLGILTGGAFWGILSDYRSRKFLLILIAGTSAMTIGIFGLLPPVFGVLPAVFLRAFMIAGLTPIAMVIVSEADSIRRRGRNLSRISSSKTLGVMLGGAMAGFLLGTGGFRWSFLALASLPLLALPLLLHLPQQKRESLEGSGAGFGWRWSVGGRFKSLYLGVTLRQAAITGAGSLVFVYMASLEIVPGSMGLIRALGLAVSTVGVLFFGWLADRMDRWRIILFGFGIAGFCPLIFAFASNAWGMAAGYLVFGMSFGSYYAGSTAHISSTAASEKQGTMLGFLESSRGLGGVLGPLIAGAVTPVIGLQGMFLTMAGIAGLGFVLVLCSSEF